MILPALDLLDGRCVRLNQGRFDDATLYSDDPLAVARGFVASGAEALHIVDLDGARLGKIKNLDWIVRIRDEVSVPIQVGGGIRTFAAATRLYKAGIDRIVFGTVAAESPGLLRKLIASRGAAKVAAGIDVREERVASEGWEAEFTRSPDQVVEEMKALGVRWVVCTDVRRAGLQTGPSTSLTAQMVAEGFDVIAAGGISSVEDVARVRETGAAGCIIGRALYTGAVSLPEAMEAARAD